MVILGSNQGHAIFNFCLNLFLSLSLEKASFSPKCVFHGLRVFCACFNRSLFYWFYCRQPKHPGRWWLIAEFTYPDILGLPAPVANATNRIAIFLQNIFSVSGFYSKGVVVYPFNVWMGISAFLGCIIGASMAVDISEELFNTILGIVIVSAVIYMAINPMKYINKKEDTSKKATITSVIIFSLSVYMAALSRQG